MKKIIWIALILSIICSLGFTVFANDSSEGVLNTDEAYLMHKADENNSLHVYEVTSTDTKALEMANSQGEALNGDGTDPLMPYSNEGAIEDKKEAEQEEMPLIWRFGGILVAGILIYVKTRKK